MVAEVRETIVVSERRVCRAIKQSRSSQRYAPQLPERDKPLIEQVVQLAEKYGRYGYRRITALLKNQGWPVNHKKVERTLAPAFKCRCLAAGGAQSAAEATQTGPVVAQ